MLKSWNIISLNCICAWRFWVNYCSVSTLKSNSEVSRCMYHKVLVNPSISARRRIAELTDGAVCLEVCPLHASRCWQHYKHNGSRELRLCKFSHKLGLYSCLVGKSATLILLDEDKVLVKALEKDKSLHKSPAVTGERSHMSTRSCDTCSSVGS